MASASAVRAGTWASERQRLARGRPPTKDHRKASRLPNSFCTASPARAFVMAAVDLEPVTHDAGVRQQLLHLSGAVLGNGLDLEVVEGGPIRLPLPQDGLPAEAGLRPFENEKLEESPVVVNRDAPLVIVVGDGEIRFGPRAPLNRTHQ